MERVRISRPRISLLYVDNSQSGIDKQLKKYLYTALNIFEGFIGHSKHNGLGLFKHGVKKIEWSMTLCGKYKIRSLNRDFRKKDKVTDVLSFPTHENLRKGQAHMISGEMLELGDIFICREVAKKQAISFEITYHQEILHLLVHGLLHLCGLDHERSREEEKIMSSLEQNLIKYLYREMRF